MSNQIEFRHLHYFLAVAEELHFRRAAEKLYISQPGLSKQIRELENNLGVLLFERHNRLVKLTTAGEYLQKELKIQFNSLDKIFHHTKLLHHGKDGNLKFGYVGSAMQHIIPELLIKFKKEHPKVLFSLTEMSNQIQIEKLLTHDIDIGFVRLERVPRGIEIREIVKEPFCLVLPKNHSINSSNFKTISQLKDESFILFDEKYSTSYYEKVMQIFDDAGFLPTVSHNTIHAGSIYKLVENNFGISIVPKSLQINNDAIQFIELTKIPQTTVLSVVWSSFNRNPILNALLKAMNIPKINS